MIKKIFDTLGMIYEDYGPIVWMGVVVVVLIGVIVSLW